MERKFRRLINALRKDGFKLERVKGAHHQFCHPDGRRVTVSFHKGSQTFNPKIMKFMIEYQAKWTDEDLKRLKLTK